MNAAMPLASIPLHVHVISSSTRLMESPSRFASQATVSELTPLVVVNGLGNHFRATATAASARALDGLISATKAAAAPTSFCAAPLSTPLTAWTRPLPERFCSHQVSAAAASCFAQASTKVA